MATMEVRLVAQSSSGCICPGCSKLSPQYFNYTFIVDALLTL